MATTRGLADLGPDDLARYTVFLRHVAQSLLGRKDGAEDLAQDALLVGLDRGPDEVHRLRAWLGTVCRNLFRANLRSGTQRTLRERECARKEAVPPNDDSADHRAAARAVAEAMTALDERSYAVVRLRYFDGLPPREIARRLGLRIGTVKRRLERALARLRADLLADDEQRRGGLLSLAGMAAAPAIEPVPALAVTLGGILVAKTLMAACGFLLLAGGLVWWLGSGEAGGEKRDKLPSLTTGTADATTRTADGSPAPAGIATSPFQKEPAGALPPSLARADRDLDLFGLVVDEGGAAVPGAEVRSLRYPWRRVSTLNIAGNRESVEVARAETDADGAFVLHHRRGDSVDLVVRAGGFAEKTVTCCLAGELVRVVLGPATPFAVVATDESGKPVPGVRVRFWKRDTSRPDGEIYDRRDGVTDVAGSLKVTDLAAGRGEVELLHDVLGSPGWQDIEIMPGADNVFRFALPAGRTITGRVTDATTGLPIAGAMVGASWVLSRAVSTDAGGRYVYRGWTAMGFSDLHVTARGYGRASHRVPEEGAVDFELSPGDVVEGRLVAADGSPVAGARLTALASRNDMREGQQIDTVSGTSAGDGSFRLDSLHPALTHTLIIQATGHGRTLLDFAPAVDGPGTIQLGEIRLPPARAIEGRVAGPEGAQFPGVTVTLDGSNLDRNRHTGSPRAAVDLGYGRQESRRTDDLGRFHFPDLAPGTYTLEAHLPDGPALSTVVELPETADVRDVVLRRIGSVPLRVRVVDDAGMPVAGIQVTLRTSGETAQASAQTAPDGRTEFKGIAEGAEVALDVGISEKLYLDPEPLRLRHDGTEVTLTVVRAATIEGTVVGPDDRPLRGMLVTATGLGYPVRGLITDESGRFQMRVRPGAEVTIEVRGKRFGVTGGMAETSRFRGRAGPVKAPASGVVVKTAHIALDRTLEALVIDPDGEPVGGASVWAIRPEAVVSVHAITGANGRAALSGLPDESVDLLAHPPRDVLLASSARSEVVPAGQTVTLLLRRQVQISGIALDEDGRPAAKVTVEATSDTGIRESATTAEDGRFRISVAEGASCTLVASVRDADGRVLKRAQLDQVTGGELTLRLVPFSR